MPLLYSAPLASNLRRQGGATAADTDVVDVQSAYPDAVTYEYSAETYSTGLPDRLVFDGESANCICVPNATGGESSGTRTELRFPLISVPASGYVAHMLSWQFKVVETPASPDGSPGFSLAQMHCGIPDTWLTWMLFETNGMIEVSVPAAWTGAGYKLIGGARYLAGEWNRINIQHWMAKDGSGSLRVWLNGVCIAVLLGQTVHADTSSGPYFKLGIYNVLRRTAGQMSVRYKDLTIYSGAVADNTVGLSRSIVGRAKP